MTDDTKQNGAPEGQSASKALLERCGTCRHFSRYTEDLDIDHHGKHAGRCDSDKFIYDEDTKPPMDGLRYWDYEGYSAGFEVGEHFGCIHWMRSNK